MVLAVSLSAASQQIPATQNPAPSNSQDAASQTVTVFKSRSELVLVPVVVRQKGTHLSGLSKEAFHLEENGKEQSIALFQEIQAPPLSTGPVVDRGFSNLPIDDARQLRLTIVVLDLLNTTMLQRADGKDQLIKFFSEAFPAGQPASLLCVTDKGLKLVYPFTTDRGALVEALQKMPLGPQTFISQPYSRRGNISTPPPWAENSVYRPNMVHGTISQLREIAQAYGGVPGRKTLIFAMGFIPELATDRTVLASSPFSIDLNDLWQSLTNANISVYPVQLLDWTRDPARGGLSSTSDLPFSKFADDTGGNRCLESNGLLPCLAEAVDDSRSYYLLGFSVRPEDRKTGWRNLKVTVAAEHINVRARSGFYYGEPTPADPKRARDDEIAALGSAVPYSAVPMFVKVLPPSSTVSSAQKSTVEFLLTIPLMGIKIDSLSANPLDLDIGAIALTRKQHEGGELLHPIKGNPKPEHLQAWAREGLKLREKLELAPDSYEIRFFARDNNTGLIGTVVFPLEVK